MVRDCFEIDELFDCSLMEDSRSVDLILKVRNVFLERLEEFLILVDDGQRHDGLLERDFLFLTENTCKIDDILHALEIAFDDVIEKLLLRKRNSKEVDGLFKVRRSFRDNLAQILVELLSDKWNDWRHENRRIDDNVEEHVKGDILIFDTEFTF